MRLYQRKGRDGKVGGVWYAWGYDANRTRWQKSTYQMDRAAAETVARELKRRYAAHPLPVGPTLDDALDRLARFKREQAAAGVRADATAAMYEQKAKTLRRVLGADFELAEMRPRVVDAFISARRAEGASESTIQKELTALRVALKLAKRAELWAGDVSGLMPIGFSTMYQPRTRALTPSELRALLGQLVAARAAHVAFLVATSARWGESVRARREDVAADRSWVHLRGTKTARSDRTVPIFGASRALLDYALEHAPGAGTLFAPWTNVRRGLLDACKRAAIPACSPNDLRRTYATWLRQAGARIEDIAPAMGHVDSRMVERVYGRIGHEALARRLEHAMIPGEGNPWQSVGAALPAPRPAR